MSHFKLILVALVCLSCASCTRPADQQLAAMRQMQTIVAMLHGYAPQVRGKPGFVGNEIDPISHVATCSWRLTVCAFSPFGPQPSIAWNSPINQTFDTVHQRRLFSVASRSQPTMYTQVFALVGPGTAFTEFNIDKGQNSGDAEYDAILLLDAKNHLIHWMEPGDVEVGPILRSRDDGFAELESNYFDGFLVAFVDGAVWCIRRDVPHAILSPFMTVDGAKQHDRDKELAPYAIKKLPPLNKYRGIYMVSGETN